MGSVFIKPVFLHGKLCPKYASFNFKHELKCFEVFRTRSSTKSSQLGAITTSDPHPISLLILLTKSERGVHFKNAHRVMANTNPGAVPAKSPLQCGWTECSEMANLRACSQCKNQWYCCIEHQRLHWKVHKPVCVKTASATTTPEKETNKRYTNKPTKHYKWTEMPKNVDSFYSLWGMIIWEGYEAVSKAVKYFFEAMSLDLFPLEKDEGIFGVQMAPKEEQHGDETRLSIGNLVFQVWVPMYHALYRQRDELRHEMVMMILMGRFPEWFEGQVKAFAKTRDGKRLRYVHELLGRGFSDIKYDILLLRFRWGQISDADMATLPKLSPVRWAPDPTAFSDY